MIGTALIVIFLCGFFPSFSEAGQKNNDKSNLVFACMVFPLNNELESTIWAESIRKFGGEYALNPIWIFVPQNKENLTAFTRNKLEKLGVTLISYPLDQNTLRFPFAAKVSASSEAEKAAAGKYELLAWMDPDNIIVNDPVDFSLPEDKSLAYRPVHHINIGSPYDQPLDDFWECIYRDCNVLMEQVFPMNPNVEDIDIRPYFNAGHLVVRPEKGLLALWADRFEKIYRKPEYQTFYKNDFRYAVFVHQAVLSGCILSHIKKTELLELSPKYNYTLNLYQQIPEEKRVQKLNDLITVRYDQFNRPQFWMALIDMDEPLRSWISERFRLRGINILSYFGEKFGANNYLNRDMFERYGWHVTKAGLRESIEGCPFFSNPLKTAPLKPDILLDRIKRIEFYDALALMPVSSYYHKDPYRDFMNNGKAMNLIKEAVQKNIPLSTMCAGARVLAVADVIEGKKILGQPPFKEEYEKAGAVFLGKDFPPQIQGGIVTGSRDQYYNYFNVLALATMIEERGGRGPHEGRPETSFIFSRNIKIAQENASWQKIIGGFGADGGRAITGTDDGGFLVTGYSFSRGTGDADMLVIKTDASGKCVWSKSYGGKGTEYGNGCLFLADGCLFVGYTTSFGAGSRDVYVVKTDLEGKELWSRTFGGTSWDVGTSLCESFDGGYMICGFTHSFGAGEEDIYVVKTDREGKELWSKTYGGKRFEYAHSIHKLNNGHYIIGAVTGTFGGGNSDVYLVEIDEQGNEVWTKSIGGQLESMLPEAERTPFDWSTQLQVCRDGGYILTGYTNAKDIMNVLVVKTDEQGEIVWGKNLGGGPFYDYGFSVAETVDGDFFVCGTTKSIDENNDILLARIDQNGRILSQKKIGGSGSDWGSALFLDKEGHLIVAGHTNSLSFGSYDVFLLALEPF